MECTVSPNLSFGNYYPCSSMPSIMPTKAAKATSQAQGSCCLKATLCLASPLPLPMEADGEAVVSHGWPHSVADFHYCRCSKWPHKEICNTIKDKHGTSKRAPPGPVPFTEAIAMLPPSEHLLGPGHHVMTKQILKETNEENNMSEAQIKGRGS